MINLDKLDLTLVDENAAEKSRNDKEAFCIMRRAGIGGSEAAVVLGVSKFSDLDKMIKEKLSTEVTDEERKVGELPSVRKGADLEPIILSKFADWAEVEVEKPEAMYRMNICPCLTVNFDGIYVDKHDDIIPVEAKLVTQWGQKYWKTAHCATCFDGCVQHPLYAGKDIKDHIIEISKMYGIPEYYYTQVQHQLLATGASYGWLVALFDKDWELHCYKIYKDQYVQDELIASANAVWEIIEERRNAL